MPVYPIDNYYTVFQSTRPTTNLDPRFSVAAIYLKQGTTFRGWAYFCPDGTALLKPMNDTARGGVILYYNLSQLPAILDVLRHEKPLNVFWHADNNAGISTGDEPIGEEEGLG